MSTPRKPREGGIQHWPTDWTAQCDALSRKTGERCPHTCSSQIPSTIAGHPQMDDAWFQVQGRPVNLCRGHVRSWDARAKRLLTLPLIDGGHLCPYNRHGYGAIVIRQDRFNFEDPASITSTIPPAWGWISWEGNVPEGLLKLLPQVKEVPAGGEYYVPKLPTYNIEELIAEAEKKQMFSPELISRLLAPPWDECPVGTIAYSRDGTTTWEKLAPRKWGINGNSVTCSGPGDLAVLVKLPKDRPTNLPEPLSPALGLIREYLWVGGTWNPELMEHDKVRDMVMLCRDELLQLHQTPAPCATTDWTPPEGMVYELVSVRGGHVFAWQKTPSPQSQVLCCVVCKKPHYILFP